VRAGTIVLFRTDWSRHFGTPRYLAHPVLDVEIAERLLAAGVHVLGTDTLNPDRTPDAGASGPPELPVHAAVLGAGGAIVENLTNLHAVDWRDPLVSVLPLRLRGLDGSPVRAVAMQP
jgi:kynurenine formamidase